ASVRALLPGGQGVPQRGHGVGPGDRPLDRRGARRHITCPPVISSSPSAHSAVIHGLYADTVRRRGRRSGPPHAWTDRHERTRKDDRTMITTTTTRDAPMPRSRPAALARLAAWPWHRLALA